MSRAESHPIAPADRSRDALDSVGLDTLDELTRRVRDIDESLRAAAEKMGQLYMFADANRVASLTRGLDKAMRGASDIERYFAALLRESRTAASRHTADRRGRVSKQAESLPTLSRKEPRR